MILKYVEDASGSYDEIESIEGAYKVALALKGTMTAGFLSNNLSLAFEQPEFGKMESSDLQQTWSFEVC